MVPCERCGYAGAPVGGYCPRCRSYRGGPQVYPSPDGGHHRRSILPVLVVLVVALIAVIGSITAIVVSRNVGGPAASGDGTTAAGPASPSPSLLADTCLVGYWRQTSYKTTISFGGGQDVPVEGDGAHLSIAPTGQFRMVWPKGKVVYKGEGKVGKVKATIEGKARGRVNLNGHHWLGLEFTTWNGTTTLYLDGKKVGEKPLDFAVSHGKGATYSCDGADLSITGTSESWVFAKEGTATPATKS